jgi:peptidoglycan/LPS O-acetylase OafA/YrhL
MPSIPVSVSTSRNSGDKSLYRPELDVIRVFAFLAVFFSHVLPMNADFYLRHGLPPFFAQQAAVFAISLGRGVDVFFVLSGYLITDLLLRERNLFGNISLGWFWLRRALRIWPVYFFMIAICVVVGFFDPTQKMSFEVVAMFTLFLGNYADPPYTISPLWTVSVEEQFYFLWPLLIRNLSRHKMILAAGFLVVGAAVSRYILSSFGHQDRLFYDTFSRIDTIGFGALLALFLNGRSLNVHGAYRWIMTVLGLGVIFLLTGSNLGTSMAPLPSVGSDIIGFSLMAAASAVIVVAWLREPGSVASPPWWLTELGKRSYGLYVYHKLCLYFTLRLVNDSPTTYLKFGLYCFGGLALTLVFALLSYRFLETPFLKVKARFTRVDGRKEVARL